MFWKYHLSHTQHDLRDIHFEVLSVSIVSYDVNWHSTLHYHDFSEVLYCLEGKGFIQTNHGRQPIAKNNMILINPYVEHTEYTTSDNPLKYVVIGVRGPELILPEHAFDSGLYFIDDTKKKWFAAFDKIIREAENDGKYSSVLVDYHTNALLLELSNQPNASLSATQDKPLSPSVSLAKNYIDNHYSKNISLDLLEERTHISKYHLSHLFKTELGTSPINYLISVRFSHALTLLETTNFSILQIAELTGFNSVNFFSTKFKERYGVTPKMYRTNFRQRSNL